MMVDDRLSAAINAYLLEKAEGNEHIHRLLKCAVEKSLLKYKPPTDDSLESRNARYAFNAMAKQGDPFRPDSDTDRKVRAIGNWLRYEQDRNAPWLYNRDHQDRPLKLATVNLDHAYNKARKHFFRLAREDRILLADDIGAHETSLTMNRQTQQAWPLFSTATPAEFLRRMTEGLPEGTHLKLRLNPEGSLGFIRYLYKQGPDEFDFFHSVSSFNKPPAFYMGASVSDDLQSRGIGRIVNGHIFNLYKEKGIEAVGINASYIGVYAHARLGFIPNRRDWHDMRGHILARLDYIEEHPATGQDDIPPPCLKALRIALESDDPKNYWFIIDQILPYHGVPLGKVLTLPVDILPETLHQLPEPQRGFYWSGRLDLTDPDCVERYQAYLNPETTQRKPILASTTGPQHPLNTGLQP